MRLLMMGTGPFAVPTFASLLDSPHSVIALVTRPTPPAVGRQKSPLNPMRDLAEQRGVPCVSPEDINAPASREEMRAWGADLLVVCDYGQILSPEALATAPLGGINLHGSLLPRYRGAAPINWAILDGQTETGVTVIHMTPRLDGGPCLVQAKTAIGAEEDAVSLEARLSQLGVAAVHEALGQLAAWDRASPLGLAQDQSLATRAPRLKKSDGQVQWSHPAQQISNQVRALKPWPGTYTTWRMRLGSELRLILERVSVCASPSAKGTSLPGTVTGVGKEHLWIATGDGILSLERVQPAGKRIMNIAEFLRGYPVQVGEKFSS